MQQWYLQLSRRDQTLLAVLGVLIVLYLIFMLAWQPLAEARNTLERRNEAARADLAKVTELAARYRKLAGSGAAVASSGRSLPAVIDEAVRRNELVMGRFQPSASGDVQVRFDNASFLGGPSADRISPVELETVDAPGSDAGLVNVSVRVYRA